jgi:hypothetical protein
MEFLSKGIRLSDGRFYRVTYRTNLPGGIITIDGQRLPQEIRSNFLGDKDLLLVIPEHPLYAEIKAAMEAQRRRKLKHRDEIEQAFEPGPDETL